MTPTHIILHSWLTPSGDKAEIETIHIQEGRGSFGGHYVVLNGLIDPRSYDPSAVGKLETGRAENVDGDHCLGYDDKSIGIFLIGSAMHGFVAAQMDAAIALCVDVCTRHSIASANVLGHFDASPTDSPDKCPQLDMVSIRALVEAGLNPWQYAASDGKSGTTGTTWVKKVGITTPTLTGAYRISWAYQMRHVLTGRGRYRLFDVTNTAGLGKAAIYDATDATQRQATGGFIELVFANELRQIEIQFRDDTGGNSTEIEDARLQIKRMKVA